MNKSVKELLMCVFLHHTIGLPSELQENGKTVDKASLEIKAAQKQNFSKWIKARKL